MKRTLLIIIAATSLMFLPKVNFGQTAKPETTKTYTLFSDGGANPNICLIQGEGDSSTNTSNISYASDSVCTQCEIEPAFIADNRKTPYFKATRIEAVSPLTTVAVAPDVCTTK